MGLNGAGGIAALLFRREHRAEGYNAPWEHNQHNTDSGIRTNT